MPYLYAVQEILKNRVQIARLQECRVQRAVPEHGAAPPAECRFQISECRVQSAECRVQSAECRVQISDYR